MALHMLTATPSFTVTLRGYDKDEVDEYIESISDTRGNDVEALEAADATIGSLEEEVRRQAERVTKLESCVRDETPRSIAALGERLTLILEQAENAASETVAQARREAEAARQESSEAAERTTRYASYQASEAQARALIITRDAEEHVRQLEESATTRAVEILDDAEAQAQSRIAEIHEWVERVRAQIRAEQQQAAAEFSAVQARRAAELREIALRRDSLLTSLTAVCQSVTAAVTSARHAVDDGAASGRGDRGEHEDHGSDAGMPPTDDVAGAPTADVAGAPMADVAGAPMDIDTASVPAVAADDTDSGERQAVKLFDGEQ